MIQKESCNCKLHIYESPWKIQNDAVECNDDDDPPLLQRTVVDRAKCARNISANNARIRACHSIRGNVRVKVMTPLAKSAHITSRKLTHTRLPRRRIGTLERANFVTFHHGFATDSIMAYRQHWYVSGVKEPKYGATQCDCRSPFRAKWIALPS